MERGMWQLLIKVTSSAPKLMVVDAKTLGTSWHWQCFQLRKCASFSIACDLTLLWQWFECSHEQAFLTMCHCEGEVHSTCLLVVDGSESHTITVPVTWWSSAHHGKNTMLAIWGIFPSKRKCLPKCSPVHTPKLHHCFHQSHLTMFLPVLSAIDLVWVGKSRSIALSQHSFCQCHPFLFSCFASFSLQCPASISDFHCFHCSNNNGFQSDFVVQTVFSEVLSFEWCILPETQTDMLAQEAHWPDFLIPQCQFWCSVVVMCPKNQLNPSRSGGVWGPFCGGDGWWHPWHCCCSSFLLHLAHKSSLVSLCLPVHLVSGRGFSHSSAGLLISLNVKFAAQWIHHKLQLQKNGQFKFQLHLENEHLLIVLLFVTKWPIMGSSRTNSDLPLRQSNWLSSNGNALETDWTPEARTRWSLQQRTLNRNTDSSLMRMHCRTRLPDGWFI